MEAFSTSKWSLQRTATTEPLRSQCGLQQALAIDYVKGHRQVADIYILQIKLKLTSLLPPAS